MGNPAPISYLNLPTLLGVPEEALEKMFWERCCELRVSVPSIVVSFDATKQTVVVQPAIQENILQNGVPVATAILPLQDVPIVMPRAGGFSVTLPIAAGDECLVVFADMCIDSWWQSGGAANKQAETRRHDLSDGFAIFGAWSQKRLLASYSTSKAQMRSDDGLILVELGGGQVSITPDNGTTKLVVKAGEIDLTAATVKINGASYALHAHTGVTTGGGNTGPVL